MNRHRNLKIVLKVENMLYVPENAILNEPANKNSALYRAFANHKDDSTKVMCLMLTLMIPELLKSMESLSAFEMNVQLMEMLQQQARHERFEVMRSLITTRMQEGSSVSAHVLKMKGFVDRFNTSGSPLE